MTRLRMKLKLLDNNFMKNKIYKVIFDTNIWISFLIGKRLHLISQYVANGQIRIITTNQLLEEIKQVTAREKLRKYFPQDSVIQLITLLETIATNVEVQPKNFICRDPKDNFLLDLIECSKADFLVTGDKDLLEHNPFKKAQIINPNDFESFLTSIHL